MIDRIRIRNFKSLRDVDLKLGRVNLFIGANASGKSNFFDALRVLQGMASGFAVDEVLNGKPKRATSEVWPGIRGGSAFAAFRGASGVPSADLRFSLGVDVGSLRSPVSYDACIETSSASIMEETLRVDATTVLPKAATHAQDAVRPRASQVSDGGSGTVSTSRSRLHDLYTWAGEAPPDLASVIHDFVWLLQNAQEFAPQPSVLRQYGTTAKVLRMGERGENFAALVAKVIEEPRARDAYVEWLRELAPIPIDEVVIEHGAAGEPLFALKEGGNTFLAHVLSDGTLRFAALVAAFFQPDMPQTLLLEEIENGLHPSRIRLLYLLLRDQSARAGTQVFATTHSPTVLAWLTEEEYATTFLCRRDEDSGATTITPLSEMPGLVELARKRPVGELLAGGWMELAP